jgi:uncharacterized protein
MPELFSVPVSSEQDTTAIGYAAAAPGAGITLILGPGAGAGQRSGFMAGFATALAARGIATITFDFLYVQQGRHIPDPTARLEACYRAVIAAVGRHQAFGRDRLAIGGKSMGGRIASQVAAAGAGDLAALVFLGYPLHPPGKPDQLRAKHLSDIDAPMLFVQGSRDAFGTPDELRPIIEQLTSTAVLHVVDGADHSFKVPKRLGISQESVYEAIQDRVAQWLRGIVAR